MNISNTNNSDYYEKLTLELAVLQEDIKLPKLPKDELNLATLTEYSRQGKSYNLIQNCYKDMIGKFYVPVLFPLVDKATGIEEFNYNKPRNTKSSTRILTGKYSKANYIELVIPKYIVMQFRDVIPKDTIFLVGFSGEHKKLSNLNIIGLYGAGIEIEEEE